jgi:thioredoxin reductase (NADPH)
VVIATGYFGRPNHLGVPGEHLPHVTHRFKEGHEAFGRPVVVIGGGNSAVDASLDLYRSGARVTLVHFGPSFDRNIKSWILPDIANRIADGTIGVRWESKVSAIEPDAVVIVSPRGEERIPALHVYLMIGYMPETELLESLGVSLDPLTGVPAHDPATMETSVPGVFIAGVLASGFDANKTFIENGRGHGELIARALARRAGPETHQREPHRSRA